MRALLKHICPALLLSLLLLTGCYDDTFDDFKNPGDYPEGEATVEMSLDFEPFVAQELGTRAQPGDRLDNLEGLCVVAFDREGNLMEGFPVEITKDDHGLSAGMVDRDPSDASNGNLAEDKTWQAKFRLKIPYGRYYLYAVANLGKYDSQGNLVRTTWQQLHEGGDYAGCLESREKFLGATARWDESNLLNNGEMLGFFTDGKKDSPSTGLQTNNRTVDVNRPGMTLHSWLRRCAAKVTVDFDGSALSDNVSIYVRRATIHDIADACAIGMPNAANAESPKIITYKGQDYRPDGSGDYIEYGSGDDYKGWPCITKATPYIMEDGKRKEFHNYTSPAMFLYENMQGDSEDDKTNKEQQPGNDGFVIGADDMKDNMPYGSYIEVEAYYERKLTANEKSHGKLIYRFMLGKDTKCNFDVERNHHYKLTLCPRGYGNDVDWHIEYNEKSGFEYKDPYYVSYLYNHDSTMRFRYTPPEGQVIDHIEAEIVANNWWPDDETTSYQKSVMEVQNPLKKEERDDPLHASFMHNKYTEDDDILYGRTELIGRTKYLGNGFLSLWETNKPVLTQPDVIGKELGDNWAVDGNSSMNDNYFYGVPPSTSKLDRSKRTYWFNSYNDVTNSGRQGYTIEQLPDDSYSINIPMFTRAKNMVKQSAYSGNNPYESSSRMAYVRVTVYNRYESGSQIASTESKILRVEQVPRITNPKGIYRESGNNEDFEVILMEKESDNGDKFKTFESDGPWMAEVIGDANFINLNGRSTIKGNNSIIKFNVRFNKMNRDDKVRNAVIRVRYHNYSCVHLIFVRQGYSAQAVEPSGTLWHTNNMIYDGVEGEDPRDEGSLFKFGNLTSPIDVGSNVYYPVGQAPAITAADLWKFMAPGKLDIATADIYNPEKAASAWSDIKGSNDGFSATSGVAEMGDFEKLYRTVNVEHGFGVLYADGATTTKESVEDVYGYCRHDKPEDRNKRGMCGIFVYYWNKNNPKDPYNCHNVFFPVGRSGYGHRRHWDSNGNGVLRYSCGRSAFFPETAAVFQPLFHDLFMRKGAIYWSRQIAPAIDVAGVGWTNGIGLDMNFFTFDVNMISRGNVQKNGQWSSSTNPEHLDACFVRCVGEQKRGRKK